MSEGTPGRAPDADPRTDVDETRGGSNGQSNGASNGHAPTSSPIRYGPRNGAPRPGGANGRSGTGLGSSQQYRSPNGSGTNGSGPSTYTHPHTGGPARPAPSEEDRQVAEARTAAAARNASVARQQHPEEATVTTLSVPAVDGQPVEDADLTTGRPDAPTEDTAVIAERDDAASDRGPTAADSTAEDEAEPKPGFFARLRGARERLVAKGLEDPDAELSTSAFTPPASVTPAVDAATATSPDTDTDEAGADKHPAAGAHTADLADDKTADLAETTSDDKAGDATDDAAAEDRAEPDGPATQERPLTWRERLGLTPKEPKPQPVDVPETGPGVPTAAAAAALAATVSSGAETPETKASPTGLTSAPQPTSFRAPVTPASPAPTGGPDTMIIPAVGAGSVSPYAPAAAATGQVLVSAKPKVGVARRTRKARLRLSRVDPWSVMKTALLFSIAAGIILVVATYGVWSVLNASGLFDAVNDMVKSVVSTPGDTTPFRIEEYVNTQKIIGVAALIAVVDVLIFTALATLGSFLYNLAATVLGGLEVTLAED